MFYLRPKSSRYVTIYFCASNVIIATAMEVDMVAINSNTTIFHCVNELSRVCAVSAKTNFATNTNELHLTLNDAKNGIKCVVIRDEANGTYALTFFKFERLKMIVVDTVRGVFVDRILAVFAAHTGLASSLH